MFLHELEPGTVFKLTDAALKAEQARLVKSLQRDYGSEAVKAPAVTKLHTGPYVIATPQRTSIGSDGSPSEIAAEISGKDVWFAPRTQMEYEVEVIPHKIAEADSPFPSRSWLFTSADPEVFIQDKAGKIVPGFAVLPTKKNPGRLFVQDNRGLYHEDGFQAEFSPNPTACHETVINSMGHTLSGMMQYVNDPSGTWRDSGYRLSDLNFVELTPDLLASGTDDQVALGCDSSENVWGHAPFTTDNPREFPYRMAGGHIHLGRSYDAKWFHSRAERIIKAMDVFCGVPSVALLAGMEDPRRRQFYGRAGEFRFQKHGLEYRVLSSAYLQHPSLTHLVFNMARGAFRLGTTQWEESFKYDPELVRHIINTYDVAAARKFVEDNAKVLIWIYNSDSGYGRGGQALTTIFKGAKAVFGESLGIHKSWGLGFPERDTPEAFHKFVARRAIGAWGVAEPVKKETISVPARAPRNSPLDSYLAGIRAGRTATAASARANSALNSFAPQPQAAQSGFDEIPATTPPAPPAVRIPRAFTGPVPALAEENL